MTGHRLLMNERSTSRHCATSDISDSNACPSGVHPSVRCYQRTDVTQLPAVIADPINRLRSLLGTQQFARRVCLPEKRRDL